MICPQCGANWEHLQEALSLPYVMWKVGFWGKPPRRIEAEDLLNKCYVCREHFCGKPKRQNET